MIIKSPLGYNQEPLLIFDDFGGDSKDKAAFPCEHLIEISNPTGDVKVHVPGDTRYTPIFFAANSSRTIIWLCNDLPDWIDKPAVQARFNVLLLPDDYRWKAEKGSGKPGDPICLDEDEEMPQVKVEQKAQEPARKKPRLFLCDQCKDAEEVCHFPCPAWGPDVYELEE